MRTDDERLLHFPERYDPVSHYHSDEKTCRNSQQISYTLVSNQAQFLKLVHGRRKAIEVNLQSSQQSQPNQTEVGSR
jgi:hypothetical protein